MRVGRKGVWLVRSMTYALPAMVISPTADSGLESVFAVNTVETACACA